MFGLKRIEARLAAVEQMIREQDVWRQVAMKLQDEKKDLLDRFMAKGFNELKTYQFVPEESRKRPIYDPAEDLGNAGTAVAVKP